MKMRFLFWICFALASSSLIVPVSAQQKVPRVALLIGNANYPDASTPLSTTIKDARTLADEFRRNEFETEIKENLGKEDMQRAIDAFTGKIRNGATALFYFSGFGIQVARQTYLIPINAQIWSEADARRDGISLDAVVAEMQRKGARVKIVIVDAAHRNPFERRFRPSASGLAAIDAPDGTLAIYSAAPGKVLNDSTGENSLFVGELLKELRVPNLTAEQVFNHTRMGVSRASSNEQVPWVASSLVEDFSFGQARQSSPAPAPQPAPNSNPAPAPAPQSNSTPKTPTTSAPPSPSTGYKTGDTFRDCPECGEVVVVGAGSFQMGSSAEFEGPAHRVTVAKAFAIGRREVTFDEWDACVTAGGCKHRPDDRGWGRGDRPVTNVSWLDAKAFVAWMSQKTGKTYRLPSEAEWEFAARGGTDTAYWWGRDVGGGNANCRDCGNATMKTVPVGSLKPNQYGLYDTSGNAAEWVEDCWNNSYRSAPTNGSAWTTGQCQLRVLRGGAFDSLGRSLRSSARFRYDNDVRFVANGFRVLRELQ